MTEFVGNGSRSDLPLGFLLRARLLCFLIFCYLLDSIGLPDPRPTTLQHHKLQLAPHNAASSVVLEASRRGGTEALRFSL